MRQLDILHTEVFTKNLDLYNSDKRFIVNQGSSRSSKTYSLLQLIIYICLTEPKKSISIVRKSFPALRGSVMRDFIEIMENLNLYDIKNHNKTEQRYKFSNGSTVEFFSIDDAQKVRGRKRDICYCNEANELSLDDFTQLSLRTTSKLFLDFNPSDSEHWIYDLLKDNRSELIKSTYKDNIFLPYDIVKEIENLINVDHNYYLIYALGERPIATTRIYTHFKQYSGDIEYDKVYYGLDFGYNHPTALVKCYFKDNKVYIEEKIYESKLTVSDLIIKVKEIVSNTDQIFCDSARPDVIEELRRNGLKANPSDKSVKEGIDEVKSREIYIHNESINLWREQKLYSWKTKGDQILDEPIKLNDDLCDALRYVIYSHKKKKFNPQATRIFF